MKGQCVVATTVDMKPPIAGLVWLRLGETLPSDVRVARREAVTCHALLASQRRTLAVCQSITNVQIAGLDG